MIYAHTKQPCNALYNWSDKVKPILSCPSFQTRFAESVWRSESTNKKRGSRGPLRRISSQNLSVLRLLIKLFMFFTAYCALPKEKKADSVAAYQGQWHSYHHLRKYLADTENRTTTNDLWRNFFQTRSLSASSLTCIFRIVRRVEHPSIPALHYNKMKTNDLTSQITASQSWRQPLGVDKKNDYLVRILLSCTAAFNSLLKLSSSSISSSISKKKKRSQVFFLSKFT